MKQFLIGSIFLASFPMAVLGQDTPPPPGPPPNRNSQQQEQAPVASPCPRVNIQAPNTKAVREGQPLTFAANIAGGDKEVQPTIVWNVSAGSIIDGQGTRRIQVDTTGAGQYREVVADIWVGGYAAECGSGQIAAPAVKVVPPAVKSDEFGELGDDEEKERVERLAAYLTQSGDFLYIIGYSGRSNPRGYTQLALKRIRDRFTPFGIGGRQIMAFDGGFREQPAFELWIVPEGAEPPRPTPTVDRREIVYPKTTPTRTTTRPVKKP